VAAVTATRSMVTPHDSITTTDQTRTAMDDGSAKPMRTCGNAATCVAIHWFDAVGSLPNCAVARKTEFYANERLQHIRYHSGLLFL